MAVDIAQLGLRVDSQGFVRADKDLSKFQQTAKKTEDATNRLTKQVERMGREAQKIGKMMSVAITAPLAAIATLSVRSFAQFDSAMTQSLAIMGDVSDAMRNEMSAAARQMAKETVFSASQAAESYFFLASAGLDAEQSIAALPQVARFAQAGMFDMARATDLATDAQSALGLTVDDVQQNLSNLTRVTDVLVKANTVANASVSQFAESLTNKAGAAMRQLNIEVESGVAVLAAWADQGVKGTEAGERFNIVTRDLQTAFRKNTQEFERFNIAVFDSEGGFRNMSDIIFDIEQALGGLSVQQQGAALSMLGFQDRSVAAIRSLLGFSDQIREYEKSLISAGGITEEVAGKQLETFSAQMELLKSRINDIAITIGESLVPHVERLLDTSGGLITKAENAAEAFKELSDTTQSLIIGTGILTAAIGPLLIVLGSVVRALQTLKLFTAGGGIFTLLTVGAAGAIAAWKTARDHIREVREETEKFEIGIGKAGDALREFVRIANSTDIRIDQDRAFQIVTDAIREQEQELIRLQSRYTAGNHSVNIGEFQKQQSIKQTSSDLQAQADLLREIALIPVSERHAIGAEVMGQVAERVSGFWKLLKRDVEEVGEAVDNAIGDAGIGESGLRKASTEFADLKLELEDIAAAMEGPLATAQLEYNRDLERMTEIMIKAGASSQDLARMQDLLAARFGKVKDGVEAEARALQKAFDDQLNSLQMEIIALEGGEEAWREYTKAMFVANEVASLGPDATEEQIRAIKELAEALFDAREAFRDALDHEREVNMLRHAFHGLQASIHPAVGALMDFADSMALIDAAFEAGAITRQEAQFTRNAVAAQFAMDSMMQMASQGSKAYKGLQVAAAALNTVLGVQAVLQQGAGDPYTAFARMAAMAGIVASLGVQIASISGSGGSNTAAKRQASQGTGSVLGDLGEKSETIVNAVEMTADATSKLVGINRAMLNALRSLADAIAGAVTIIARQGGVADFKDIRMDNTFGNFLQTGGLPSFAAGLVDALDIIGIVDRLLGGVVSGVMKKIFGFKSKVVDEGIMILSGSLEELIDGALIGAFQEVKTKSLLGSKRKEQFAGLDEEISTQIGLIFSSMADAVTEAARALGVAQDEIDARLATFRVAEQRISLMDLSAEEQEKELQAVFSRIFDDLAAHVIPFIRQFQQVGEGMGETLVRVATSVLVFEEAVLQVGFSIGEMTKEADPEAFAKMAVGMVELVGGIERFIERFTNFLDKFATEEHKFSVAQDALNRAFEQAGLVVPETREAMWELMQTLDATTEEGREHIAMLLEIADAADAYYKFLEKADRARQAEEADRERQAEELAKSIARAGNVVADFLGRFNAFEQLKSSFNEAMESAILLGASQRELDMIQRAFTRNVTRMADELRISILSMTERLFGGEIEDSITGPATSGFNQVRQVANQLFATWERAIANLRGFTQSLLLDPALSPLTPLERVDEAMRNFLELWERAMAGDVEAANQLPEAARILLDAARFAFASGEDYQAIFDFVMGSLSQVDIPGQIEQTITEAVGAAADAAFRSTQEAVGRIMTESLERLLLATDLAVQLRNLSQVLDTSVIALADELGIPLAELVEVLGVELGNITEGTAEALAHAAELLGADVLELADHLGISVAEMAEAFGVSIDEFGREQFDVLVQFANTLGASVTDVADRLGLSINDLATAFGLTIDDFGSDQIRALFEFSNTLGASVGEVASALDIQLGHISDATSLLGQAFRDEITNLPTDIQEQLNELLSAIANAATEADANQSIRDLAELVSTLDADIGEVLRPFLEASGIEIPVPTELSNLINIASSTESAASTLTGMRADNNGWLSRITTASETTAAKINEMVLGSFQTGGFVPSTGLYRLHENEFVVNPTASNLAVAAPDSDDRLSGDELSQIRQILESMRDQDKNHYLKQERTTESIAQSEQQQAETLRRAVNS